MSSQPLVGGIAGRFLAMVRSDLHNVLEHARALCAMPKDEGAFAWRGTILRAALWIASAVISAAVSQKLAFVHWPGWVFACASVVLFAVGTLALLTTVSFGGRRAEEMASRATYWLLYWLGTFTGIIAAMPGS